MLRYFRTSRLRFMTRMPLKRLNDCGLAGDLGPHAKKIEIARWPWASVIKISFTHGLWGGRIWCPQPVGHPAAPLKAGHWSSIHYRPGRVWFVGDGVGNGGWQSSQIGLCLSVVFCLVCLGEEEADLPPAFHSWHLIKFVSHTLVIWCVATHSTRRKNNHLIGPAVMRDTVLSRHSVILRARADEPYVPTSDSSARMGAAVRATRSGPFSLSWRCDWLCDVKNREAHRQSDRQVFADCGNWARAGCQRHLDNSLSVACPRWRLICALWNPPSPIDLERRTIDPTLLNGLTPNYVMLICLSAFCASPADRRRQARLRKVEERRVVE